MSSSPRIVPAREPRGRATLWIAGVPTVGLALLGLGFVPLPWRASTVPRAGEGVPVRRGPLRIAVIGSGSLHPAETVKLVSAVEGRTTILALVAEGTAVKKGDIVCELDATAMVERRIEQSIRLGNAEAALVKARQNHQIQESQNRSDILKARRSIEFAEQDLQMFLEGERDSDLEKARQAIDLAREEEQQAKERLGWSEKLGTKGFLTAVELETDRIAHHRTEIALQTTTRDFGLLERFRMPRKESELRAGVEEAKRESERVELQAKARLVDFESDVSTCEATRSLEVEKLSRLDSQIEKAKLRAPGDGFVVYAQRDNDEPQIQEGTEIREREEILSIPSSDGVIAQVKLHESVLEQVQVGQPCVVKVDALPGAVFEGRVSFVAMLPDQNMRWMNPNLRLYRTEATITSASPRMRPGMSCSVEILIEEIPDTVYVPVQCVFQDRDRTLCFVSGEDEVEKRDVRVGRANDLWVQILAGLAEGETVLLSPPPGYAGGSLGAKRAEKEAEKEAERAKPEKERPQDDASSGSGSH